MSYKQCIPVQKSRKVDFLTRQSELQWESFFAQENVRKNETCEDDHNLESASYLCMELNERTIRFQRDHLTKSTFFANL